MIIEDLVLYIVYGENTIFFVYAKLYPYIKYLSGLACIVQREIPPSKGWLELLYWLIGEPGVHHLKRSLIACLHC